MNICEYRPLYIKEILSILNTKKICNVSSKGLNGSILITPMLYTFDYENDNFTFYLININNDPNLFSLKNNDRISIFLEDYTLGFYIDAYKNTTATGIIDNISNLDEQNIILTKFKKRYSIDKLCSKNSTFKYIKVNIDSISGRQY